MFPKNIGAKKVLIDAFQTISSFCIINMEGVGRGVSIGRGISTSKTKQLQ